MGNDHGGAAAGSGRALILSPIPKSTKDLLATRIIRDPDARLEEACGLALAIELDIVHSEWISVQKPKPATYFGRGVVDRFAELAEALEIDVIIIDTALTPVQQRNLETAMDCKVIDRTALILEIFGARARTHEGRLQVELASLTFQRSRLVRSWTHLERQRGGAGFLGGPGESQLEIDRRLIDERVTRIKKELEEVKRTRELHRQARKRVPFPVVALVGYTNAGKSTLFNRLTEAKVMAKDLLFATLDPTMRRVQLPNGREVILSDTVGFISDLPTHLVAAFRATLEEVREADIILHVRDISHPDSDAQKQDVLNVLEDLDLPIDMLNERMIEVLNKIDLLPADDRSNLLDRADVTAVSAITGEGLAAIETAIDKFLSSAEHIAEFDIDVTDGAAVAWLYKHGDVLEREDGDARIHMCVRLADADNSRFQRQFPSYF